MVVRLQPEAKVALLLLPLVLFRTLTPPAMKKRDTAQEQKNKNKNKNKKKKTEEKTLKKKKKKKKKKQETEVLHRNTTAVVSSSSPSS